MSAVRVALCALGLAFAQLSSAQAQASAEASACVAAHTEAQRLRMAGQLLAARAQVLACAQSECPELVANDCALWLPELDADLSSVVLAVDDGAGRDLVDVRVFANDRLLTERTEGRALPLDPGSYSFRFEAAGYRPLTVTASVRQAEKNRIVRARLELDPAQARDSAAAADSDGETAVPVASYVLGGVALASLGAFTYFAVTGKEEHDRLEQTCGHDCTSAQVEDGKRAYIIADVALGVGIASAATAVILLLTAGESPPSEGQARTALQLDVTPRGGSVRWTSRY